jgi:hypothetical protein
MFVKIRLPDLGDVLRVVLHPILMSEEPPVLL